MTISFTINNTKALQTLLWILNKKPGIHLYNIMKVVFSAECYHLNKYGRPIYGDEYKARPFGTVPEFMYGLTRMEQNVPFYKTGKYGFKANSAPDMRHFSNSDIEALEYGMSEYSDLTFDQIKEKNHKHRAWKNHEAEILKGNKAVLIDYEEMIDNPDVLEDLKELGNLTQSMVL